MWQTSWSVCRAGKLVMTTTDYNVLICTWILFRFLIERLEKTWTINWALYCPLKLMINQLSIDFLKPMVDNGIVTDSLVDTHFKSWWKFNKALFNNIKMLDIFVIKHQASDLVHSILSSVCTCPDANPSLAIFCLAALQWTLSSVPLFYLSSIPLFLYNTLCRVPSLACYFTLQKWAVYYHYSAENTHSLGTLKFSQVAFRHPSVSQGCGSNSRLRQRLRWNIRWKMAKWCPVITAVMWPSAN